MCQCHSVRSASCRPPGGTRYEVQEFASGEWITRARSECRIKAVRQAHARAVESGAPPMRVVARTGTAESGGNIVVYRSWCPYDWPQYFNPALALTMMNGRTKRSA